MRKIESLLAFTSALKQMNSAFLGRESKSSSENANNLESHEASNDYNFSEDLPEEKGGGDGSARILNQVSKRIFRIYRPEFRAPINICLLNRLPGIEADFRELQIMNQLYRKYCGRRMTRSRFGM